ncbi:MAG: hypothetical protein CSA81_12615 [Acidobacteria bacterium]|nr:MAG: hypothetical protein CSA81_12615 [Acidobacteriota bacterium]
MLNRARTQLLLLALLFFFSALFLVWILNLRFEAGDVYPAYSSFRVDPQGCKALYESLERIPCVQVERNSKSLKYLAVDKPLNKKRIVLLAGMGPLELDQTLKSGWLRDYLHAGGHVLLALKPHLERSFMWEMESDSDAEVEVPAEEEQPTEEEKTAPTESCAAGQPLPDWYFRSDFEPSREQPAQPHTAKLGADISLAETQSWHSGLFFHSYSEHWRPVYEIEAGTVCMEWIQGEGRLIALSDAYFLSNESLWKDKQTDFLIWLLGNCSVVVFDETHLGVVSKTHISDLVFRYRFQGIVVGFLLLGVLFLWKNGSPLIPPSDHGREQVKSVGRDVTSGLVNMLKRSIPKEEILGACFQEWEKTVPAYHKKSQVEKVRCIVEAENERSWKDRDTRKAYHRIQQIISKRRVTR